MRDAKSLVLKMKHKINWKTRFKNIISLRIFSLGYMQVNYYLILIIQFSLFLEPFNNQKTFTSRKVPYLKEHYNWYWVMLGFLPVLSQRIQRRKNIILLKNFQMKFILFFLYPIFAVNTCMFNFDNIARFRSSDHLYSNTIFCFSLHSTKPFFKFSVRILPIAYSILVLVLRTNT